MTVLVSLVICHDVNHKWGRKILFAVEIEPFFLQEFIRFLPLNFLIKLSGFKMWSF